MNNKPAVITLSIGVLFLVATLAFAFNLGGVSDALPLGAQAAFGLGGCAFALIVCGLFALAHKPTRKELVEQNDERNVAIGNLAATRAFTLFSVLVPVTALVLWVLGLVTLVGMFVFVGIVVVAFIAYVSFIAKAQKTM